MKPVYVLLTVLAGISAVLFGMMTFIGASFAFRRAEARDFAATLVFAACALVATRCTFWLSRPSQLVRSPSRIAEVVGLGFLILTLPLVGYIEQRTEGVTKALVQIGAVLAALATYAIVRAVVTHRSAKPAQPTARATS